MISMISGPCEAAREQSNAGDHDPGLGAGDGGLEVLRQTSVASEPGEGAFDDPAARLGLEGADCLRSCDDFDRPRAQVREGIEQLLTTIDTIGEDVAQLRKAATERSQHRNGAVIILNVGRVYE